MLYRNVSEPDRFRVHGQVVNCQAAEGRIAMPAGRPSAYREAYAEQARKLCLLGATDAELASFFSIHESTLNLWKDAHPEFMESIALGKDIADAEIADKLYHRARGYSHDAVKIFMPAGAEEPVYAPYIEHFPPDTTAASLWLRNRQPAKWRDRTEVDMSGDLNIRRVISEKPMTEAEWNATHADKDGK